MSAADDMVLSIREYAGLIQDVIHLAEGNEATEQGSLLSLGKEIVYGIAAAYKNGTAIIEGASGNTYEWKTYRPNVKVNTAPVANDHYFFRIKTGLSDASIEEHVDRAKDIVLGALRSFYETTESIDTQPTFLEIVRDLAAGKLIQMRARGVAMESAHYRTGVSLETVALARIRAIQQGKAEILDSSNVKVARKSNSVMGGFTHSEGEITSTEDWWKRMRMHNKAYLRPPVDFDGATAAEAL